MSAADTPKGEAPDSKKSPRRLQRVLTGPRRRRFYGAVRRARVPELATLLRWFSARNA